jgi:hypothetical protein
MQTTITDPAAILSVLTAAGQPTDNPPTRLILTAPKSATTAICACGCGITTSGGTWAPGHDAKRKSVLYAMVRGDDKKAATEAKAELKTRDWPMPAPKKPKTAKAETPAPAAA